MEKILSRLNQLKPRDLSRLSEAIDRELQRRVDARNAEDAERQSSLLPLPVVSAEPRRAA